MERLHTLEDVAALPRAAVVGLVDPRRPDETPSLLRAVAGCDTAGEGRWRGVSWDGPALSDEAVLERTVDGRAVAFVAFDPREVPPPAEAVPTEAIVIRGRD